MWSESSLTSDQLNRHRTYWKENIASLQGQRLLIIGDVGVDEYLHGEVRRISPEAPVPVLEVNSSDQRIGLAGNVAQNVVSLGGEAILLGVVGEDSASQLLRSLLCEAGVKDTSLVVDPQRATTRKTRLMAGHHHLLRVDHEHRQGLSQDREKAWLDEFFRQLPSVAAVVIEDYAKGMFSQSSLNQVIEATRAAGKKVMVDPAPATPFEFYRGAHLLTPNRQEALGMAQVADDYQRTEDEKLKQSAEKLFEALQNEHLVITRGKEGMDLFSEGRWVHLPTYARQVFDVTGAGDTVIAALGLAWAAGHSLERACVLANFAAGLVVGKVGCVACSSQDLLAEIGA